jgi:DNA mismatch endonuclease (patch repair protein)
MFDVLLAGFNHIANSSLFHRNSKGSRLERLGTGGDSVAGCENYPAILPRMADVVTTAKRSEIMAAVRSRGNKNTELKLLAVFRAAGIVGWRRHQNLPGCPDFVFSRNRLAVFVDGCFWHGCHWHCRMPKTRTDYWNPKIARNKNRDREVMRLLRQKGWRVYRIWEHSLKDPEKIVAKIQSLLGSDKPSSPALALKALRAVRA